MNYDKILNNILILIEEKVNEFLVYIFCYNCII